MHVNIKIMMAQNSLKIDEQAGQKCGINIFTVKGRVSHYYFSLYWFTFGEKLKFIVLIINIFAVYAGPIFSAIKISTMKYVILNLIF